MVYKQYLHKDLGNSHYIYCLQDGTKAMAIANDGDDDDVTMHQLRRARIHVEVDDGKQVDQGNLPTFCIDGEVGSTPDREENYTYVRQRGPFCWWGLILASRYGMYEYKVGVF